MIKTILRALRRAWIRTLNGGAFDWVDVSGVQGTPVLAMDGETRIGTVYAPLRPGDVWLASSIHRPGVLLSQTSLGAAMATIGRIDENAGGY